MNIPVVIANTEDWEFVMIEQSGRKVMSVF